MVLRGHEDQVFQVGISPDNHWLVTGSEDRTARLWDLTAKDPAANPVVLRGHEGAVYAVGISPDNHWLVTGSEDRTARLWPLQVKDLIDLARITADHGRPKFHCRRVGAELPRRAVPQDVSRFTGSVAEQTSRVRGILAADLFPIHKPHYVTGRRDEHTEIERPYAPRY